LILLDTHVAIWYGNGTDLKPAARRAIDMHLKERKTLLSAISAWEIGMLVAKGRISLPDQPAEAYIDALFSRDGISEEPITAKIAEYAARLPEGFHGDPADRLIVSTAVLRSAALITRDERILAYAKRTRLLTALAA
jgi:PIN domain nuclease of toxin-antitoxin system